MVLLVRLGIAAVCVAACASGCATGVNTLETDEPTTAGTGGTDVPANQGGQASSGGSGSMVMAGAAGSKVVNAFGGTASSGGGGASGTSGAAGAGGKPQGGAGAGGQAPGGASGSGGGAAGAKNGGAAGQTGTGGSSGQAGTGGGGQAGGSAGSAGTGGASLTCLTSWKNDPCDVCSKETQSDHLACVDILDCYAANSCGPATCSSNDDKCGVNKIGKGTAGYPIAKQVYDCLCK